MTSDDFVFQCFMTILEGDLNSLSEDDQTALVEMGYLREVSEHQSSMGEVVEFSDVGEWAFWLVGKFIQQQQDSRRILINLLKILYCMPDVPALGVCLETYIRKRLGYDLDGVQYAYQGQVAHMIHDDWAMPEDKRKLIDELLEQYADGEVNL